MEKIAKSVHPVHVSILMQQIVKKVNCATLINCGYHHKGPDTFWPVCIYNNITYHEFE